MWLAASSSSLAALLLPKTTQVHRRARPLSAPGSRCGCGGTPHTLVLSPPSRPRAAGCSPAIGASSLWPICMASSCDPMNGTHHARRPPPKEVLVGHSSAPPRLQLSPWSAPSAACGCLSLDARRRETGGTRGGERELGGWLLAALRSIGVRSCLLCPCRSPAVNLQL